MFTFIIKIYDAEFLKYWISGRIMWIDQNIYNTSSIVSSCSENNKQLVQIVDELGRNVASKKNKVLFYIYDNGCVEKKFITYQ